MPAFARTFRLAPRPDVIFFLTDGIIPATVPAEVARLNGKGKNAVPIHTILFGGELPGEEERIEMAPVRTGRKIVMVPRRILVPKREKDDGQLEQISRESGGTPRSCRTARPERGKAQATGATGRGSPSPAEAASRYSPMASSSHPSMKRKAEASTYSREASMASQFRPRHRQPRPWH